MKFEKNSNLFNFFADNNLCSEDILDILRYDIFGKIYYYGDHFKLNSEGTKNKNQKKLIQIAKYFFFFKSSLSYNKGINNKIISNAYFGLGNELNKLGYSTFTPPWQVSKILPFIPNYQVFKYCNEIINNINNENFNYLTSNIFIEKIKILISILEAFFLEEEIKAVIFPNDLSFFENLALKIFKKISKPSFIFLHGLPGRYNGIDDNRAEYLIVWGDKIKDLYVKSGVNENKIIVAGHPIYSGLTIPTELRNNLANILVLTQSIPGKCDSSNIPINDRANLIYYLYSIKKVLQKLGVSKVRLRCHPGENINWYIKYIDNFFFTPETTNTLKNALDKSSIVIGPTSTVVLESIYHNVNYITYEPILNKDKNLLNQILVPPFNKSDNRVPTAHSEEELEQLLIDKKLIDTSFIKDYIAPKFDLSIMKDIIG